MLTIGETYNNTVAICECIIDRQGCAVGWRREICTERTVTETPRERDISAPINDRHACLLCWWLRWR